MRQVKVTYRVHLELSASGRPFNRILIVSCGCTFRKRLRYSLQQDSKRTYDINAIVVDIDGLEFRVNTWKRVERSGILGRLSLHFDIETTTR